MESRREDPQRPVHAYQRGAEIFRVLGEAEVVIFLSCHRFDMADVVADHRVPVTDRTRYK